MRNIVNMRAFQIKLYVLSLFLYYTKLIYLNIDKFTKWLTEITF